ncbi:MAG: hypothetical protein ACI4RJ_03190, partial [Alphaproteobacteria bacterium]
MTENEKKKTVKTTSFFRDKRVLFSLILIGLFVAVPSAKKAKDKFVQYIEEEKERLKDYNNWDKESLIEHIFRSPAVLFRDKKQIMELQGTINEMLEENGQKDHFIAVDGQFGPQTSSAVFSLTKEQLVEINEHPTLLLDSVTIRLQEEKHRKYAIEGLEIETQNSYEQTRKEIEEEYKKPTSAHFPTTEQEIREAEANKVRSILFSSWFKNKTNYNPEVESFQRTVNKILGNKLKVDGQMGRHTEEMLLKTLTPEQLAQVEAESYIIQDVIAKYYICNPQEDLSESHAERVKMTLLERFDKVKNQFNQEVLDLQKAINKLYDKTVLNEDGIWGKKTREAFEKMDFRRINLL